MSDYAYKKVKLSDRQKSFCSHLEREHSGKSDHVGIDYGGWTAHNQIVAALKKKGVLVSGEKRYELVVGEPLIVADPKFDKPYIKVTKQILTMFNGECRENYDTQIYLDPRGECRFHIIMPYDIGNVVDITGRANRHDFGGSKILVAYGKSLEEVVANVNNLTTEYSLLIEGEMKDVLRIIFESKTADPSDLHYKTELGFNYAKMIQSTDGALYYIDKNGYMKEFDRYWATRSKKDGVVVIPWTQEREAALAALRQQLIDASDKLRSIIFAEDFIKALDAGGKLLLENKNV